MVHRLSSELQGRATAATFIEPRAAGSSSTKELERNCKLVPAGLSFLFRNHGDKFNGLVGKIFIEIIHAQHWFFEERLKFPAQNFNLGMVGVTGRTMSPAARGA